MAGTLSDRLRNWSTYEEAVVLCNEAAAELDRREAIVAAAEAWARAMRGPTTVPPVLDRSIEDTEQALLTLIPEAD